MSPGGPLRRWQLVDVGAGTVTTGALRVDERVLHYLAGVNHVDDRISGYVEALAPGPSLPASQQQVATTAAGVWARGPEQAPVIQLCGPDRSAQGRRSRRRPAARSTCRCTGSPPAPSLPAPTWIGSAGCGTAKRPCSAAPCWWPASPSPRPASTRSSSWSDGCTCQSSWPHVNRCADLDRATVRLDVPRPTLAEQRARWLQLIEGEGDAGRAVEIDRVVGQFDVGYAAIDSAVAFALAAKGGDTDAMERPSLWDACRAQSRARLDDLAQRVEPAPTPTNLVLPEAQLRLLRDLTTQVRHRAKVYDEWGFADVVDSGSRHHRPLRRSEWNRQDAGGRGDRPGPAARSVPHRPLGRGQQVHRRDREEPPPRVRRGGGSRRRPRSSTRPTPCSASAAR